MKAKIADLTTRGEKPSRSDEPWSKTNEVERPHFFVASRPL